MGAIDYSKMLRELIENGGALKRQRIENVTFEESMELLRQIGEKMVPGFVIDDSNRFVYENIVRWCMFNRDALCLDPLTRKERPADMGKGIYLAGATGTGKSICLDLINLFIRSMNIHVKDDDTILSLQWKTYRADDICDSYSEDGDLRKFKTIPILCIQDLGAEPEETIYMGNRRKVMRSLLEHRGDCFNMMTIISSNIPIDKLQGIYGARVQSRIYQMCNYYELKGKDRRI